MRLAYRAHLAWSLQCGPQNFVTFDFGFIFTYPIDLVCLVVVLIGAGANIIGEPPYYGIPKIFRGIFLPMSKISFFLKLEWLKILKDIFEEDYQMVATEISHNFIFLFYSEFFLSLA